MIANKIKNTPGNSLARFVAAPSGARPRHGPRPHVTSVISSGRQTGGRVHFPPPSGEGEDRSVRASERAESFFSALSGAATGSSVHHVDSSDIQWISLAFVKVNDKT